MESTELLIVGCGPAGATAAREAARSGVATFVLEKDARVGEKRVCAAGLRPGFCEEFDLPRAVVHCDTPRLALFDAEGGEHELFIGAGHTSTREELDGTMAALAVREGAQIRTGALFRGIARAGESLIVQYADLIAGERQFVRARNVFFATGATARLDEPIFGSLAWPGWRDGLVTTLQHRVYLDRPAAQVAYRTLELHYYAARDGRQIVAWMFPKRDHLAIGLGVMGKMAGDALEAELDSFAQRVRRRLYPDARVLHTKREGHLLYGGMPRPAFADGAMMVGGTAAGLVDATNGEGIYEAAASGRFAAEAVAHSRVDPARAGDAYGARVRDRFAKRLAHRVRLMRYLERKPRLFAPLFTQLSKTPRLAEILLKPAGARTHTEQLYVYAQALRFGLRALVPLRGG